eukprot:TRINITY_DN29012_c0_g1_i1.p2 TRINITY_DN29012_c0_g1~~TRINITY_DN29012_c0_g1_i1.p2  ORF type:complete len:306 (+),score=96.21 TRINITY_DN29012_c0_g1_i1:51-920(+)
MGAEAGPNGCDRVSAVVVKVVAHDGFAAKFKHPVKFNGTDFVETRLTPAEQRAEVEKLATTKLHVFLERYGTLLSAEDLSALAASPLAATAEVRFWLEKLAQEPATDAARQKRGRRRRWLWAKREMARPDGYFSEESMKHRDPKAFHQVVGRHLAPTLQLSAPMQGSLSSYLIQRLERECEAGTGGDVPTEPCDAAHAAAAPGEAEGDAEDDAMSDAAMSDEEGGGGEDMDTARRAKFLRVMRDRFVNGDERNFDYARIDDDSDLDDVAELGRDAEEKYFDAIDSDEDL